MRRIGLVLLILLLPAVAFGEPVLTWDFDNGTVFDTGYTLFGAPLLPPMTDGYYVITTDPNSVHDLFASFGDHTTGSGSMMVVNASQIANTIVWGAALAGNGVSLVEGAQYELSFWAARLYGCEVYPGCLYKADLQTRLAGVSLGSAVVGEGTGVWQHFGYQFTAGSAQPAISIVDLTTTWRGNDFALDDITLSRVDDPPSPAPEPASFALGLAGLAALVVVRRKRAA